ncbi:MAG: hypothetical protein H0T42_08125 [Deltaproteobacteria bacterium]|nr:hypothetical protein [Deltaproteobacteria bacterium]
MRALRALAMLVIIAACRDPAAPPPKRATLLEYLGSLAGTDPATRAREVATWELDRVSWERTVVPPYAGVHADYARSFEEVAPRLVARLAIRSAITTRPHFAGDPRLTRGQAQARWALPVQFPSEVAELDGIALDAVFVRDGERWRAIVGLDGVLRAKAAAIDPVCAAYLDITNAKSCSEIGWVIADSALASDRPRFKHACSLASNLCAN